MQGFFVLYQSRMSNLQAYLFFGLTLASSIPNHSMKADSAYIECLNKTPKIPGLLKRITLFLGGAPGVLQLSRVRMVPGSFNEASNDRLDDG